MTHNVFAMIVVVAAAMAVLPGRAVQQQQQQTATTTAPVAFKHPSWNVSTYSNASMPGQFLSTFFNPCTAPNGLFPVTAQDGFIEYVFLADASTGKEVNFLTNLDFVYYPENCASFGSVTLMSMASGDGSGATIFVANIDKKTNRLLSPSVMAPSSALEALYYTAEGSHGVLGHGVVIADTGAFNATTGELMWTWPYLDVPMAQPSACGPASAFRGTAVGFVPLPSTGTCVPMGIELLTGASIWNGTDPLEGNAALFGSTVYYVTLGGMRVVALDMATGRKTWEYTEPTGANNSRMYILTADRFGLVVVTFDGQLLGFSAKGAPTFRRVGFHIFPPNSHPVDWFPVTASGRAHDGQSDRVYICTMSDSAVWAFDRHTGMRVWQAAANSCVSGGPVYSEGTAMILSHAYSFLGFQA